MAKKHQKTNAMRILDSKKIEYNMYTYEVDENHIDGISVAQKLNQDEKMVFKTLVTVGKTNNHYVFLVPVEKELDLKKAAKCVGEKKIDMIKSKELLGLTGYIHGGCSPIGMKKFFRTTIDETAGNFDTIMFSGGKIGYQVETSIEELKKIIKFELADITTDNK